MVRIVNHTNVHDRAWHDRLHGKYMVGGKMFVSALVCTFISTRSPSPWVAVVCPVGFD